MLLQDAYVLDHKTQNCKLSGPEDGTSRSAPTAAACCARASTGWLAAWLFLGFAQVAHTPPPFSRGHTTVGTTSFYSQLNCALPNQRKIV